MKYKDSKNKIRTEWNTSLDNEQLVNDKENEIIRLTDTQIFDSLNSGKSIVDYSTDWVTTNIAEYFGSPYSYKQWQITFPKFSIKLIPFISIAIMYQKGTEASETTKKVRQLFQTRNITDSNEPDGISKSLKRVIIDIVLQTGYPTAFKAKVNIRVYNPEIYT